MSSSPRFRLAIGLVFSVSVLASPSADEGMWTFDNPPLKGLKEKYGFTPTREWLEHIRLSAVRFNDGGSGSFVSASGLVLTNHHVALGQLQKLSSAERNYVRDGFFAATADQELKCPDLELNVLVSMDDVTSRVKSAVKPGMDGKQALEARRAFIAQLEKESLAATGLRSDVVTLYHGGEYWIHRYKKYTDIRVVFAPEQQAAFFGGDPDNFTFPRYDLDFTLVRAYDNGAPVKSEHYLKWKTAGAADGELVFVAGHPGSTDRLRTVAELETQRDHLYPTSLKVVKRRLGVLRDYARQGEEPARQAADLTFGLENALKALTGEYNGLLDTKIMGKKQEDERAFLALVNGNDAWKREYGGAWAVIAEAEKRHRALLKPERFQSLRGSQLAGLAAAIVRYGAEIQKPDGERLDGYHDAQLPSLLPYLTSPRPFHLPLEEALLSDALQESVEELGAGDPFVKAVVGSRRAADVAKEAVQGSRLADPAFRKSLVDGGPDAIAKSTDPLLVLARAVDPFVRATQRRMEDEVESVTASAAEKIGQARFAAYGRSAYPDATFTLRLSYGAVKGYPMNGTIAPPLTTFYGLYDRATSFGFRPPFNLPQRFVDRKSRVELATPLNFVSTNDIIGGNSGSPVINREGEIVGLVFDGNIESLVGRFVYSDETNRTVSVHAGAIVGALRQVYDAGSLADELEGKTTSRQ
jgi:hypothetical protein